MSAPNGSLARVMYTTETYMGQGYIKVEWLYCKSQMDGLYTYSIFELYTSPRPPDPNRLDRFSLIDLE